MPDDTLTPKLPNSATTDAAHTQAKESDQTDTQPSKQVPAETKPDASSNPASLETKDATANGKVDEFEVPADIQSWPDEKPVISKEDEDRLLKVKLSRSKASLAYTNPH